MNRHDSDRAQRVQDLFEQAIAIDDAGRRAAFVREICANDSTLRREVESLLARDDPENGFLEGRPVVISDSHSPHHFEPLRFGDYELLDVLGRGGMGIVFKARQIELDRLVAVKIMPPVVVPDEHGRARFEREMKALAKIDHANVVKIFDARRVHDRLLMVMEYVDGIDLYHFVKHPPHDGCRLLVEDACEITREVALALENLHLKDFVHRDVKPLNVLLTADGSVKLLDFGLVRIWEEFVSAEQLTRSGYWGALGTPEYMAPEQWSDSHNVTRTADIYSLGCTLYFLLTKRHPFHEFSRDEQRNAHLETPVPAIDRFLDFPLPSGLADVIARMLQKRSSDRYPTAAEVAAVLTPYCSGTELSGYGADVNKAIQLRRPPEIVDSELDALRRMAKPPSVVRTGAVGSLGTTVSAAPGPFLVSLEQAHDPLQRELATVSMIPHEPSPCFTGRQEHLAQIHEVLAVSKKAALSGMGGIGKTQIALAFARQYHDEYRFLFWVNAATAQTLSGGFLAVAEELKLPEVTEENHAAIVAAVKRWLKTHNEWLLILDNADDLSIAQEYIPQGSNGHVLLTTRAQPTTFIATPVDIGTLSREEGVVLLLRRAGLLDNALLEDREAASQICDELGDLPLALDQAGAYIESAGSTPMEYLELYRRHGSELRAERGVESIDYPMSVATTWQLNFEKIEVTNSPAADLLRLVAFLSPDRIPEEIVSCGAEHLGDRLGAAARDQYNLNAAYTILNSYSLLRRNRGDRSLTVHRLVQLVQRDRMDENAQRKWAERAIRAVNAAFPDVQYEQWGLCERLLTQVKAAEHVIAEFNFVTAEASRLLYQVSGYLRERGVFDDAECMCRATLAIREKTSGTHDPTVGNTLVFLSTVLRQQGKYADAEASVKKAIAILESDRDLLKSERGHAIRELAELYKETGRYAESEVLYNQAIQTATECHGPEHPSVTMALKGLAWLHRSQGKYAEAERVLQSVVMLYEKTLANDHPELGHVLGNLAVACSNQGKMSRAEELYQRSIAIKEKAYGLSHPQVARSLNNLASLCHNQGDYARAEALYQRSLEIKRVTYGHDHPSYALGVSNLVDLYIAQRRDVDALPLAERALDIRERVLGPNHPYVAWSLINLAVIHCRGGESDKGQELADRGLSILERTEGSPYTRVESRLCDLGEWYSENGEESKAELMFQRALTSYQVCLPPDDPRVIKCRQRYVAFLRRFDRHREADELLVPTGELLNAVGSVSAAATRVAL